MEMTYEEIENENKVLLRGFERDLTEKGLSDKTIDRHVFNAELFLNTFLLYREELPVDEGASNIDEFFYFFVHKCLWSTPNNVKTTAASLKKLFRFLMEQGRIEKAEYKEIAEEIKEGVPVWQESCRRYNEYTDSLIW